MPRSTCSTARDVPFWQHAPPPRRAIARLHGGPRVARRRRMSKLVVCSTIALVLLAPPAFAQPAPPPPAPPPASAIRVALSIKAGPDARTHELVLSDDGCGTVQEKANAYEDNIRVCSRPAANGLRIETDWFTRSGPNEYRSHSEIVLPRKGGTSEIGRSGGVRLALKLG
jgi:hypothetical protein